MSATVTSQKGEKLQQILQIEPENELKFRGKFLVIIFVFLLL